MKNGNIKPELEDAMESMKLEPERAPSKLTD